MAGKVQLQGPDDQFATWREVERYKLPDTPLSSSRDEMQALAHALERDLGMDKGDLTSGLQSHGLDCGSDSPSHSPASSLSASPEASNAKYRHQRGKSGSPSGIPQRVRPLINFVVWRAHHQDSSVEGSGHYILLTNDAVTQKQAQKFGIRAKQMSQVSAIVARNAGKRLSLGAAAVETSDSEDDEDIGLPPDERPAQEDADDQVLFDPSKRPQSSRSMNVLDPNAFGRQPLKSPMLAPTIPTHSSRGSSGAASRGRGSNGKRGQRGKGSTARNAKAPAIPQSPKQAARGATTNPRPQASLPDPSKPIDPDSYARAGSGGRSRGRGGNRGRLWEPT